MNEAGIKRYGPIIFYRSILFLLNASVAPQICLFLIGESSQALSGCWGFWSNTSWKNKPCRIGCLRILNVRGKNFIIALNLMDGSINFAPNMMLKFLWFLTQKICASVWSQRPQAFLKKYPDYKIVAAYGGSDLDAYLKYW